MERKNNEKEKYHQQKLDEKLLIYFPRMLEKYLILFFLFILFKNGKELNMLKIGTTIKPSFLGYEI
jgi:hypothetical protein